MFVVLVVFFVFSRKYDVHDVLHAQADFWLCSLCPLGKTPMEFSQNLWMRLR